MKAAILTLCLGPIVMTTAAPQTVGSSSEKSVVDKGNNAWIIGMQKGDADLIAGIYAEDALNCGRTGDCTRGRAAIVAALQKRFATTGLASAATVSSQGTVREGGFIYEWGSSKLEYRDGHPSEGRYLTVWQLQDNGEWQIFRNLSIPDDRR